MEMPGYLDYGKMMEQNPLAYDQSMTQLGLAKLYQAEKQKQAENTTLEGALKNDQSRQMNPMLLEQQFQTNVDKGMDNQNKGMTLGMREQTYDQELQKKIDDFATQADESKLKSIEQKINLAMLSGDPQKVAQAKQAEQFLASVRESKRKSDAALLQVTEPARIQAQKAKEVEQMGIDAGKYVRVPRGNNFTYVQKLTTMAPATRLGAVKSILDSGISPDTHEPLTDIEQHYFKSMYDQDAKTVDAGNAARGQGQGVTAGVNPAGNVTIVPKVQPSVTGNAPSVEDMRKALKGK